MKLRLLELGILLVALIFSKRLSAQPLPFNQSKIDSLKQIIRISTDPREKVSACIEIASMCMSNLTEKNQQDLIYFARLGDSIADKNSDPQGAINSKSQLAFFYAISRDWPKSIDIINTAIEIAKKHKLEKEELTLSLLMFINYGTQEDYVKAKEYTLKVMHHPFFTTFSDIEKWPVYMQLAMAYERLNELDSADNYIRYMQDYVERLVYEDLKINTYLIMGNVALKRKNYHEALRCYRLIHQEMGIANVYFEMNLQDSAALYALKSVENVNTLNKAEPYKLLSKIYEHVNPSKSLAYFKNYLVEFEKTLNINKLKELESLNLQIQKNKFAKETEVANQKSKMKQYFLLGLAAIFLLSALFFIRSNRIKQKLNETLNEQKSKIEDQHRILQSTQAQLIQSEKMASLGELTAGIAHEIQNPLNFVNNFSSINNELINEAHEELAISSNELALGNIQSAKDKMLEASELLNDVKINSEKINQHGNRASSIVKGMLEHSRKSSGVKEPTDINKLCDEFVRLSYHGLRAKDKNFNCDFKLDLDPNLPLVNVVSQDIGRVLLNVLNNAFQACNEKQQNLNKSETNNLNSSTKDQKLGSPSGVRGKYDIGKEESNNISLLPPTPEGELTPVYKPLVIISTKYVASSRPEASGCEIKISDNGPGIPDSIKDKIFQPFFTTKPTGQGTGLGLSLAYDIVKAHGGEIKLNTNENKGSEFIIILPI